MNKQTNEMPSGLVHTHFGFTDKKEYLEHKIDCGIALDLQDTHTHTHPVKHSYG